MAKNYVFHDDAINAMLDGLLAFIDTGTDNAGWAIFDGAVGTDPPALPSGNILKVGALAAASFVRSNTGSGATRKGVLTMATEGAELNSVGHLPATGVSFAIFQDVDMTNITTAEAHIIAGSMVVKGNLDVSANTPWAVVGSTTITDAVVDLTESSCLIEMLNTGST